MQRYILIVLLFFTILLTGCSENQDENNDKKYKLALSELEKTSAENNELEMNLNAAKNKIEELENQITSLKEELEKQNEEKTVKEDLNRHNALRIIAVNEKGLKYVLDETSTAAQSVSIIGCNIDDLVENYEEVRINGLGSGEYFRAEVIGSIYDLQLIQIEWNDETEKIEEVKVIHELDEVKNQTIYIETYLPCGMPSGKIKWKDSKGDTHEILLANDGYGFDGSIIWTK